MSLEKHFPQKKVLIIREPGTTPLGLELRKLLLERKEISISVKTQVVLFIASRLETWTTVIAPALDQGHIIIADRWHLSTIAYQSAISKTRIKPWIEMVCGDLLPYYPKTIVLDLPINEALSRIKEKNPDRYESLDLNFYTRLRDLYINQKVLGDKSIKVVDAQGEPEEVQTRLLNCFLDWQD